MIRPVSLPGLEALGYYRGALARAIRAYKYRGTRRLAFTFASALGEGIVARGWRPRLITHVPLHSARRRLRGYDQARELSRALATRLSLPHGEVLARTRLTQPQSRLGSRMRRRNVASAFAATGPVPESVLLVDDVFTTGATLGASREALELAGGKEILLAVVAIAAGPGSARCT